jgi:hypothetical protein
MGTDLRDRVQTRMKLHGETTTAAMKANHERDAHSIQRYVNRTWTLTRSIVYTLGTWSGDKLAVKFFALAWYADAIENGTARTKAYPFFWKVVQADLAALTRQVVDDAAASR